MSETEDADYVCVTPIKVKGKKIQIGESTILAPEKNLIVVKDKKKKVK